MSMYKFMAGMVQDTLGNEPDFDPHAHRVILHPTSYIDTMTHMLKGSIGAGILAIPHATKQVGIIWAAVMLSVIGAFATYTMLLLIKTQYLLCKRHKRGYMSYQKSIYFAVKDGPNWFTCARGFFKWFVETTLILWQLGICTIYFVFVAENVVQVANYHGSDIKLRQCLMYLIIPMIMLNLIKNLKMLSPLSTISNIFTTVGLLLVAFYLIEDDLQLEEEKLQLKSMLDIPLFLGTALFALEAVGVVLALEYNMENPKQFGGVCGLFSLAMTIIVILYVVVGMFGYLKYGDKSAASITLNLPKEQKKAQAAKMLFTTAIFCSFPLQNFVAYSILWRRVLQKIGGENCPTGKRLFFDYTLRIFLVLLPWALAVAVPTLGPFIALFGALCLSLLAFVFPAIMSMCVWYAEPTGYGPLKYRLLRDIFIFIAGIILLISGVTSRALAVAVPTLGPFIALFGALCLSLLAFVFPAIMSMCVWYAEPTGYGPLKYRLLRDIFIFIAGIILLISGVTSSVLEIIEEMNKTQK